MLASSVTLVSILVISLLSGGEVLVFSNLFGEAYLEISLFSVAALGGAFVLTGYVKRIVNRRKADGEL
jgi:energy-converting hydrogenase Eha subunit C